jgi:dethiobiotin synthetase
VTTGEPAPAHLAAPDPLAGAPSVDGEVQPDRDTAAAATGEPVPSAATGPADPPRPATDSTEPGSHGPDPASADLEAVRWARAQEAAEPPHGASGPARDSAAPACQGAGPACEGAEPAVGGVEPACEGAEPAVGGVEPAGGGVEPACEGVEPACEGAEPASGGAEAAAGSPGPAGPADGARPKAEADGAHRPAAARAVPRPAEIGEWRGVVLITGTDTDVGKTIVTSAIAAAAQAAGLRVAVVKPGQTGTADGGPTDADLVNRLARPHTVRTLASYPDPLAPLAAARVAALPPLELYEVVDAVRAEAESHDLVLVEGAGGLLVPMGVRPAGDPWTFADLAVTLGVGTIVVTRAGLGTLNHTALTLEALARRGVPAGVVLGAWPAEPELVHWANLSELVPHLVGALPDGAGAMDPGVFRRSAPGWLTPALYGVVDNWRTWAEEVS